MLETQDTVKQCIKWASCKTSRHDALDRHL